MSMDSEYDEYRKIAEEAISYSAELEGQIAALKAERDSKAATASKFASAVAEALTKKGSLQPSETAKVAELLMANPDKLQICLEDLKTQNKPAEKKASKRSMSSVAVVEMPERSQTGKTAYAEGDRLREIRNILKYGRKIV